jgi:UDP-N-acetylglucosamine--N-acetylmuramyl-(pentapeptide) pyrophosphoryl-undecaprenol N-acetylglucosamine transferase
VLVADADLTPTRLRQEVQALLADPERRERMAEAARSLARPDAAATIAEQLLELAR